MEPANAELAEDVLEVKVLSGCLGNCGICTVGASDCAADTESALGEVQTVTAFSSDTVCLHPLDEGSINTALADEVFHQTSDFVIRKCSDDSCLHAEAFTQTADNVVFSAAFPCTEGTCCTDSSFSRVKSQHYFAEAGRIICISAFRLQIQIHDYPLISFTSSTASLTSSLIFAKSPALTRSPFTIQLPPQAIILLLVR